MENELNPSNMNAIVQYLTGYGNSPSAAEQNFMTRNTIAGMPFDQAFELGSRAGMANTHFSPQERAWNEGTARLIENAAGNYK